MMDYWLDFIESCRDEIIESYIEFLEIMRMNGFIKFSKINTSRERGSEL